MRRNVNGWTPYLSAQIDDGAQLTPQRVELGGDYAVTLTRSGHAVATSPAKSRAVVDEDANSHLKQPSSGKFAIASSVRASK
jgi:hypothetical protein